MSCQHSGLFHVSYPIFSGLSFLAVNMMFKKVSGGLFNPGNFLSLLARFQVRIRHYSISFHDWQIEFDFDAPVHCGTNLRCYFGVDFILSIGTLVLLSFSTNCCFQVSDKIFTDYALGSKLMTTSDDQPHITRLQVGF